MSNEKILKNNLTGETCWGGNSAKAVYFFPVIRRGGTSSHNLINKWSFHFAIFTSIQFIVFTSAAIFFYPGGSWLEPTTLGYPFFRTFYSELGMTFTSGGRANLISAVIFAISLTFIGLGIAVFYFAMRRFFHQSGVTRVFSTVGTISGIVSGILYIGVALTPINLFLGYHAALAILGSQAFLTAVLCYAIAIFKSKKYPIKYGIVYLISASFLLAYLSLCKYGPGIETAKGLVIQATMQKMVVLSAIVCILIQSWGAIHQEEQ